VERSGQTTLLTRVIPRLSALGLRVSTISMRIMP